MTRVLVPVAVLDGESVPLGLMTLLGTADVTILGYHVLPEQTPPDQARLQYEERANAVLADTAEEFREAGGAAEFRLVFTQDRAQTIKRVAAEVDADAFTIRGASGTVERLLVSLSGDVAADRILAFVADLVGDRDIDVTLLIAGGDREDARARLDRAAQTLTDRGLVVETHLADEEAPLDALLATMADHDAIVMGEQAPTLTSFLLGELPERVAAETVGPVLVVRRPPES